MSDDGQSHDGVHGESTPSLEELIAAVPRLAFYRVLMHATERFSGEDNRELLHRHLLWVREWERRGTILFCGPLNFGEGWDGGAMCVLRADSLEEARVVAEGEPYHVAGLRRNVVDRWTVNEGSLTVRVDLMRGAGRLA